MKRFVLLLLCLSLSTPALAQRLINGDRVLTGTLNACPTTGSGNAYACTLLETIAAYNTRQCFLFQANHTNTGTATLNVNGLGAKTIKKFVAGVSTDLIANDISNGQVVQACYDGTNMQLPPGSGGGGGSVSDASVIFTDITTGNASTGAHGFLPKLPGGTTSFLRADGTFATPAGSGSISDTNVIFTDITTGNASTGAHGFMQKYPGGTTAFLRADGTFATPAGGGNVSNSGAPNSGEVAEWTNATTVQGVPVLGTGSYVKNTNTTLVTPTIASFVNAGHTHQSAAQGGVLTEASLSLTDVATGNASVSAHGFLPKLPGGTTTFLNASGSFSTPAGGGNVSNSGTPAINQAAEWTSSTVLQGVAVLGTGSYVKSINTTLITPTIASFANAPHTHQDAAGGGVLAAAALPASVVYLNTANAWGDGVKQTFNPSATTAGVNVGGVTGDPSAPANGDLWYDSTANELTARINGVNVALGTGVVSDTDKGDLTVSAAGTVWTIDPGVISLAKMATMATASLLGRNTAGTGAPEVLSAATAKTLLALNLVDNTSDATKNAAAVKLENKRIKKRVLTQSDVTSITINADLYDLVSIAELSQPTTFAVPTGTHDDGDTLWIALFTTVARPLTFVTSANGFAATFGLALPTTSTAASWVLYGFKWRSTTALWEFVSSSQTTTRGTAGQCYMSNGPNAEPTFQACAGGGGGIGYVHLPMSGANLPAGNPAVIDNAENNTRLLFDAATPECAIWQFRMPPDYVGSPVLKWQYSMTSATTNGISLDVSVMAVTPGDSADINTDSYAAVNNCDDAAVPTTAGFLDSLSCTLTNADGVAANDFVKLKVCRATGDAGDTATGDMEGVAAMLEYAK